MSSKRKAAPTEEKSKKDPQPNSKKQKSAKSEEQKAVPGKVNHNEDLTNILAELGQNEKNSGQPFKAAAYFKAVNALKTYPSRVSSGAEAEKLPGIGKKIAKKIDEILSTGKLQKLEREKQNPQLQSLNALTRVTGIGPKVALKLYKDHKITSLDELKAHQHLLNHHQQIGLRYVDDFEQRIPRAEMDAMFAYIRVIALQVDPELILTVCGSYRRGAEKSGDIDVLVTARGHDTSSKRSSVNKLLQRLKDTGFVTDELAKGDHKFMGVCILTDDFVRQSKAEVKNLEANERQIALGVAADTAAAAAAAEDDDEDLYSSGPAETKEASPSPIAAALSPPEPPKAVMASPKKITDFFAAKGSPVKPSSAKSLATPLPAPPPAAASSSVPSAPSASASSSSSSSSSSASSPVSGIHRRIDVRFIPYDQFYCALLYFTGSDAFNRHMRLEAIKLGYRLNEYGVCTVKQEGKAEVTGPYLPVHSEKDVFDILKMKFVPPRDRNM